MLLNLFTHILISVCRINNGLLFHRLVYSSLIVWLIGILFNFLTLSCTSRTMPTDMTLDRAIRLTQTWAKRVREPFDQASIAPNADFRGVFSGAEISYSAQEKMLTVEGLVIQNARVLVKNVEFFNEIKRVGDREPYTRGEGYFYIEPTPSGYTNPQLTLRKDFTNGSIDPAQFVREVDWLLEWSTHWRMTRYPQLIEESEEERIRKAPEIEAWAKKNRPRPW